MLTIDGDAKEIRGLCERIAVAHNITIYAVTYDDEHIDNILEIFLVFKTNHKGSCIRSFDELLAQLVFKFYPTVETVEELKIMLDVCGTAENCGEWVKVDHSKSMFFFKPRSCE